MGLNYRKKIKIAPGVKLNVTKKGVSSVSIGKRGASFNINKHGSQATFGIPGSGISYKTKRSGAKKKQEAREQAKLNQQQTVAIGQNQVTVEQIINNKDHALALMNTIGYNYEESLVKKPLLKRKKQEQQKLLEQTIYNMQNEKVTNRQITLSVEQVLRDYSLIRFAKQENLLIDNMTMYQAGLLIYIGTYDKVTKKVRKEFLEDTIVELASADHLLLLA